jgi:hypothetical protein
LASGYYVPLLFVALLDLSIGTALLASSVLFWQAKPAARTVSVSAD